MPAEAPPYLTLKLAHELYRKPPERLDAQERQRVAGVAARQLRIEQRILATPEAAQVVLPLSSVDQSVGEIRNRYPTPADFAADLATAGLDAAALRAAVARDLKVEAVLERIASRAAAVSGTEVDIFYFMHRERFRRPETRTLRHILVTINDRLPGSERAAARAKIDDIRARLVKAPARFGEQALKHSECPTAMNGGLLGEVPRAQLFPQLETLAFALAPGELSAVGESPLGFHLLICDAVRPAGEMPLADARARIRNHLEDVRRRSLQKAWIADLFRAP
jgi:nitrogen fixation protein NifM